MKSGGGSTLTLVEIGKGTGMSVAKEEHEEKKEDLQNPLNTYDKFSKIYSYSLCKVFNSAC